jgi:SPX domain protein involved in polyphosphate accumulation
MTADQQEQKDLYDEWKTAADIQVAQLKKLIQKSKWSENDFLYYVASLRIQLKEVGSLNADLNKSLNSNLIAMMCFQSSRLNIIYSDNELKKLSEDGNLTAKSFLAGIETRRSSHAKKVSGRGGKARAKKYIELENETIRLYKEG